ncbi:MAG TPA: prepilin-type N-terminal cleavage/methylation domain-containing protein [Verrucomicrobiae bacterium]|jgi:prepilin-type N-terminal cleavage/methylation domain-containing protein|nr:prepilin-type N-terminal cleavage/methylation domain-containing protein [Verrucomicrobiae bacterium]
MKTKSAFSLVELLVVIAIIAILAAIIFPVLSSAKARANRTDCVNNLRQIDTGLLMYAHDDADTLPQLPDPDPYPNGAFCFYKELIKGYVGLSGPPRQGDKLFICPSETPSPTDGQISTAYIVDYTDYDFNGWLTGVRLTAIKYPSLTALGTEASAMIGYSWHQPQPKYDLVNNGPNAPPYLHAAYNNAMNEVSYPDGHINYIKIYNDGMSCSMEYNPPAGYEYQWYGQ